MDAAYITLLVGIIAAFIAAITNLVIGLFRNKAEHNRELVKLAKELALADLEDARKRAREDKGHKVRPTSSYVWYYFRFLKLIDKGDFNKERIKKHLDEYAALLRIYAEHPAHLEGKQGNKTNESG